MRGLLGSRRVPSTRYRYASTLLMVPLHHPPPASWQRVRPLFRLLSLFTQILVSDPGGSGSGAAGGGPAVERTTARRERARTTLERRCAFVSASVAAAALLHAGAHVRPHE
eukprot:4175010-Prymnesium_polylepis.1